MTANKNSRVCCVEGLWEESRGEEPTIKPMLKMLCQWQYWPKQAYQRCGTVKEMKAFLNKEWLATATRGSVLFFATHGSPGSITLSSSKQGSICLHKLARLLSGQCEGCIVHFSACEVIKCEAAVKDFLKKTGAIAVSGYRTDVGWVEAKKPALLADLMLLNELWETEVNFSDGRRTTSLKDELRRIEGDLQRRFGDCQFEIVPRNS